MKKKEGNKNKINENRKKIKKKKQSYNYLSRPSAVLFIKPQISLIPWV
jgi:hypothetical protein